MVRLHVVLAAGLALACTACRSDDRIRVACIGDSITFGSGLEDREKNCYPSALQELLGDGYNVRNFGHTGTTLLRKGDKPYVRQGVSRQAMRFRPHVVVIKLGTNDTKPQNWVHVGDFADDYKALVGEFQALDPAPQIYLCVPVPAYRGNFGIDDGRVRELKPRIEQVGRDLGLPVIDLYSALSGKRELFPDEVHPNPAGARLIAAEVHRALTANSEMSSHPPANGSHP